MTIRLTSWNVNGIRNPFGYQPWRDKRTFDAMFDILEADIVIMQELKIQRKDLRDDMVLVPGWDCYFSLPKQKKGYSGVGIYTRQSVCNPIHAEEGVLGVLCPPGSSVSYCDLPVEQHIGGYLSPSQLADVGADAAGLDSEGRCVVLEFPAFVIFGIYSPANSSGLRDDFRYGFLNALDMRVRNLVKIGKRVVVTGDLNVSRAEIDTANAVENMKKEGISHEEYMSTPNRRIFNQLLEGGEVFGVRDEGREEPVMYDVCRGFHPGRKGMFTHWEQKINARPGNFGSRIDFILCSLDMKQWFRESDIQEGLMGSDHCPVYATIHEVVRIEQQEVRILDLLKPRGAFECGKRVTKSLAYDTPAFSAKLMPEFHQRRSIKDMLGRKPMLQSSGSTLEEKPETIRGSDDRHQIDPGAGVARAQLAESSTLGSYTRSYLATSTATSRRVQSPEKKRPASQTTPAKPAKKSKTTSRTSPTALPSEKLQQSLKGFFQTESSLAKEEKPNNAINGNAATRAGAGDDDNDKEAMHSEATIRIAACPSNRGSESNALNSTAHNKPPSTVKTSSQDASKHDDNIADEEKFIDPVASMQSWSKLFTKPVAPRCEHEEPCKVMKTKKTGFNCGREFYMCARPLGPSGGKEKNTQWRCHTFIWSSDWLNGVEKEVHG